MFNDKELVYAHVFHRHGERTIAKAEMLPNDDVSYWKNLVAKRCNIKSDLLCDINDRLTGSHIISHKSALDVWNENFDPKNVKTNFTNEIIIDSLAYPKKDHYWMGKLTENGINQLKNVGKYLRDRYVIKLNYLSPNYDIAVNTNPDGGNYKHFARLWCGSTAFSRTLFSANALLEGLYPLNNRRNSESDSKTGDIPIHICENSDFTLLFIPNDLDCKYLNFKTEQYETKLVQLFEDGLTEYKDKYNKVKHAIYDGLGITDDNVIKDWNLRGSLSIRQGIDSNFLSYLQQEIDLFKQITTKIRKEVYFPLQDETQFELRQMYVGRLLNQLMILFKNSKNNNRFIVSSTHDNTIAAIKLALGCEFDNWPIYGETLIFEIWQNKHGQRFVKVLVNDEVHSLMDDNCELVDLSVLENKWKDVMIDENKWQTFCNMKASA